MGVFLFFFIDWRNDSALSNIIDESGLTMHGKLAWNKKNCRPRKNGFKQQIEFIIWGTKGAMPKHDDPIYLPGIFNYQTLSNKKVHITQKPLQLMEEICQIIPPNGTIFDPFMGSGTTGHAALIQGKKFIGCETVPQYFNTATERLSSLFLKN